MASNPIITGFNPDPTIIRVGDDYFVATSSFEYFPGVPIYHSRDLVNWKVIGHALTRRSQLDLRNVNPGGGIWAPTLRYHKGTFYLATAVVYDMRATHTPPRGFYVSTTNIWDETTWSDPVFFDQMGIDQDLLFDDDDRVYLCTARKTMGPRAPQEAKLAVYACEIDLATGDSLCPPVLLSWHKGVSGGVDEGPHLLKKDGFYYLFIAEGGTDAGHTEVVLRSHSPLGPYEEPPAGINPLVFNGGVKGAQVQNTGHADFVEGGDGRWWAVLLATRAPKGGVPQLGRETFLAPVQWKDGWPIINGGQPITATIPADLPTSLTEGPWTERFTNPSLDRGWYHLRTPLKPCHTLTSGTLTLHGNAQTLDNIDSPAALFRKQKHYAGIWSAVLTFEPDNECEEAGTTIYYGVNSYAAVLVRKKGQGREVVARWKDEDIAVKEVSAPISGTGPITLTIQAGPTTYTLLYGKDSDDLKPLRSIPSTLIYRGVYSPLETPFTGTMLGIFAQCTDGEMCRAPAVFSEVGWTPAQ